MQQGAAAVVLSWQSTWHYECGFNEGYSSVAVSYGQHGGCMVHWWWTVDKVDDWLVIVCNKHLHQSSHTTVSQLAQLTTKLDVSFIMNN